VRARVESEPLRWVTRAGLAANGVLHLLVAWLAVRVALGTGARADQAGALQAIAAEPFGRLLVWLLVAGFAAVVVWRAREALWGFRYATDDARRTRKRLFSTAQALVFGILTGLALRVTTGSSSGSGGSGLTATVLGWPAGRWLVVLVGVGVVVTGLAMGVQGWRKAFTEDMALERASHRERTVAVQVGRVGALAKAVSFVIIGILVALAGLTYRPDRAEGLDAALKALAAQRFGPTLLLAVAAGLACFGVFCFFDARYHRV
jgi:hypothetical protein